MKSTDIVQPQAMPSVFGEDIYSAEGSINFEIPDATSTSASDTCVMDNGFLPITSEPLDDGGIAPERKNFNGLFYLSTDQRVFLQNGGFITYNSAVASAIGGYPEGAILGYIDSNNQFILVQSLIDDNTNDFTQNPSLIDNINWKVALNFADVDLANTVPAQSFIDKSIGWVAPDWSNKESKILATTYTAETNGYVFFTSAMVGAYGYYTSVYVNDVLVSSQGVDSAAAATTFTLIVAKGDTYRIESGAGLGTYYFVPIKGV